MTMPRHVFWEVTYACPLRCSHCYTESGRRPARQMPFERMMQVADILVGMRAGGLADVGISGGEPLIVDGLFDVTDRLSAGGLNVIINVSGQGLTPELAQRMTALDVHVSVDGPDAATHDRIRGRSGAFSGAIRALEILDRLSRQRVADGERRLEFGISTVLVRSNFRSAPRVLLDVASRFPELRFARFDAVVPQGLASRESYEDELLTEEQMQLLANAEFARTLRTLVPPSVQVEVTDNLFLQSHPSRADHLDVMSIEPDGDVRALPIYGGTVGNILRDDPEALWSASLARRSHPFLVDRLSRVQTVREWASAVRQIEEFFAAPAELARIRKRKAYELAVG